MVGRKSRVRSSFSSTCICHQLPSCDVL
jgi:hypothetical protein